MKTMCANLLRSPTQVIDLTVSSDDAQTAKSTENELNTHHSPSKKTANFHDKFRPSSDDNDISIIDLTESPTTKETAPTKNTANMLNDLFSGEIDANDAQVDSTKSLGESNLLVSSVESSSCVLMDNQQTYMSNATMPTKSMMDVRQFLFQGDLDIYCSSPTAQCYVDILKTYPTEFNVNSTASRRMKTTDIRKSDLQVVLQNDDLDVHLSESSEDSMEELRSTQQILPTTTLADVKGKGTKRQKKSLADVENEPSAKEMERERKQREKEEKHLRKKEDAEMKRKIREEVKLKRERKKVCCLVGCFKYLLNSSID